MLPSLIMARGNHFENACGRHLAGMTALQNHSDDAKSKPNVRLQDEPLAEAPSTNVIQSAIIFQRVHPELSRIEEINVVSPRSCLSNLRQPISPRP